MKLFPLVRAGAGGEPGEAARHGREADGAGVQLHSRQLHSRQWMPKLDSALLVRAGAGGVLPGEAARHGREAGGARNTCFAEVDGSAPLVRAQGQAEYFLEKLHGMAEKQVIGFLDGSAPADGWGRFRENLIGLTDVTRSHFDKLVLVRPARPASPTTRCTPGSRRHSPLLAFPFLARHPGVRKCARGRLGALPREPDRPHRRHALTSRVLQEGC